MAATTGTGTINDPYIVSEWSEFVSKCAENDVYIKIKDKTVWDMNSIHEEAFTETPLILNCASVDGNGAEITNVYLEDCSFIQANTAYNKKIYIYNLKILDFYETFSSSSTQYFINSADSSSQLILSNVVLRGDMHNTSPSGSKKIVRGLMHRCALTLSLFGSDFKQSEYGGSRIHGLSNCNIKIYNTDSTQKFIIADLYNSQVTGDFSGGLYIQLSIKSSINADIHTELTTYNTIKYTIINADKVDEGISIPSGLIQCTDEEMHNAQAIRDKVFPIGV